MNRIFALLNCFSILVARSLFRALLLVVTANKIVKNKAMWPSG